MPDEKKIEGRATAGHGFKPEEIFAPYFCAIQCRSLSSKAGNDVQQICISSVASQVAEEYYQQLSPSATDCLLILPHAFFISTLNLFFMRPFIRLTVASMMLLA